MQQHPAVAQAWDVYRQPARYRKLQNAAIPAGILDVIKIAAGDTEATARWVEELGATPEELAQASPFYLHQFMAGAGNNPLRLLCLDHKATPADIKLHKRWLLKWLHPDRNPSAWEANLFRRVNDAAHALERDREAPSADLAKEAQADRASVPVARLPTSTARVHGRHEHRLHRAPPPVVRMRKTNWAALRMRIYRRVLSASALLLTVYAGYEIILLFTDRNKSLISHVALWWE